MYTVFVNNKPIILSNRKQTEKKYDFYLYNDIQVEEVLYKLRNTNSKGIYLYHERIGYLWDAFQEFFEIVEAAGGMVIKDNSVLLIYRNNHWDLPKGKMEFGESVTETAIREVTEECGLKQLRITSSIENSYHVFYEQKKYKLKKTHWFTMHTSDNSKPIPQKEEGITIAEFTPIDNLSSKYNKMYANIRFLIEKHLTNNSIKLIQ